MPSKVLTYGLITHADMDACGARIFLEHALEIKASRKTGYAKLLQNIDDLANLGCTVLVVADIGMSITDIEYALEKFAAVFHFDHHMDSIISKNTPNKPKGYVPFVNENLCSAELAFNFLESIKSISDIEPLRELARLIGIYDLWKKDHKDWNKAYALALLFDMLEYDEFLERFFLGFRGFSKVEINSVVEKIGRIKSIIDDTPTTPVGEKDTAFLVKDGSVINEYTLYRKSRAYFMIYTNKEGLWQASLRLLTDNDSLDLNAAIKKTISGGFISPDTISSGGGHKKAAGINFTREATIDDVLLVCESVSRFLDEMEE